MDNYSWLQKKIHKIALSSQFMREITFDVERALFTSIQDSNEHLFICGLARSGTTVLLNSLYHSNEFASLSYQDMPFVLAPNLWSKMSFLKKETPYIERAHGDGIEISLRSPEAFEEVFWRTFDETEISTEKKFANYVHRINQRYQKNRYLSKNNQNINRLNLILKIFPTAKILIPFRLPLQHSYSLLNQHKKFIHKSKTNRFISDYMKWTCHTEFGPNYEPLHNIDIKHTNFLEINHWLEQWFLTYERCFKLHQKNKRIKFVCFEKLCSDNNYWKNILKFSKVKTKFPFDFVRATKSVEIRCDKKLFTKSEDLYEQLNISDQSRMKN